ncbi:hypothetical protein [Opitutus terrae]|uniref:Uncharacterized protein n=1 Tax=Opitutus terrae (strain DSM 11246 / JCM 15787 / PB90-1) TaxID=452637 RepID=B1ZN02_OPITP|nr:hypothetical protein [Opitutus terrae]ACB76454.1 hypothetical protein Oter_3174 [Opitutus terrae PB90-1]
MQATESSPQPARRWSVWRWLAIVLGACALIVAIGIVNVFTLSRDAAAMRRELFSAMHTRAQPQVQIDAGPGTLTLARGIVGLIHDVPPEAHRALDAVRAASVGVYHLSGRIEPAHRAEMVLAVDKLMTRRDWMRIVGVTNPDETVLIYAPAKAAHFGPQRVCLAVCDGDKIVIVSAVVKAEKLVELLHEKHALEHFRI